MDFKKLKKYAIPALVVFIVLTIFDFVFHGIVMEKLYTQYANLFRPQNVICNHKYFFWLANLIYSFAFYYIYSKGHEKGDPLKQGVRFALWIILLTVLPCTIVSYTIYPHPKNLELAWLLAYSAETILAGITAAMVFPKIK